MPIILFFLSPAISLVYVFLMNIKKHKRIFSVFTILFSLSFGYFLTPKNTSLDSFQIIQIFKSWNTLFPSYSNFLDEWLTFDNSFAKDLFEGSIFSFVHLFSDNYHYIFLLCALVFTIFKLKSFDFFLRDYTYNKLHIILSIFFFTSIPLFEINGFRFFTASWIAVYSTLKCFVDKKNKYLFLLAITPLVHITFIFYLGMVLSSYIINKWLNEKVIIYWFVISVVIGLVCNTLPDIGDLGDGILNNLLKSYINDDYKTQIDTAVQESNFIKIFSPLRFLFYNATALVLYLKSKDLAWKTFLRFLLISLSIANCVYFIPSMGRFFVVLTPIILISLNREVSYTNKLKYIVYLLPIVEAFRIYQVYFTLYPDVIPNGFMINILLT